MWYNICIEPKEGDDDDMFLFLAIPASLATFALLALVVGLTAAVKIWLGATALLALAIIVAKIRA